MTRLWLVRNGKNGEYEARATEQQLLTVDFTLRGDPTRFPDRDALIAEMARLFPERKTNTHKNFGAQVNQFINMAQDGDLVVSPMKTSSTVWAGRISGPARALDDGMIARPVTWFCKDLARDTFRQDLLYSFGAFMTVCEISRNNALDRVQAVVSTGRDPGDGATPVMPDDEAGPTQEASDQPVNLERIARDQIERRVASSFTRHDFTELVAAILRAQGYTARVSPPGADRGVDIVGGSGPLGLESPKVTVQVKSGDYRVDQPDLQGLIGSVHDTQADHGLIVSWGGFTNAVRARTNELYFRVRLWGRDEIVDNLLAVYDRLPEAIQADLPLRRTWTLVLEVEGA